MKAKVVAAIALGTVVLFVFFVLVQPIWKAVRIKEIDAQLANWVSTGRPEDANRHSALKAERALLAAHLGYLGYFGYSTATTMPVSPPMVAAEPVRGAPTVVVAPDSTRTENRWQSMSGDASWMDTTRQTQTRGRVTYGSGYYYDTNGRRVYYNTYP